MAFLPGRLGSLLARDLMSTVLLVLQEDCSVDEASQELKLKRHSGAPVVDSDGRLVGTFSVRDMMQTKRTPPPPTPQEQRNELASGSGSWLLMEQFEQSPSDEELIERVKTCMRKNPPSVNEKEPLIIVARLMCDHHMHRIPVIDNDRKLVGIISTMDILAALVHTADESELM